MTKTEALKMAKAELECSVRKISGKYEDCNSDCDNCTLCYEQGTTGQHIEWLEMIIELLEQEQKYIKVPKKALKYKGEGIVAYNYEWFKEHFDIEIKAILGDLEPCDVISREDVIDACNQSLNILEATDRIKDLPPVYPKAKVGKWIRWYEIIEQEHCTIHDPHCKCSECNIEYEPYIASLFNYCPNCGTKMKSEE